MPHHRPVRRPLAVLLATATALTVLPALGVLSTDRARSQSASGTTASQGPSGAGAQRKVPFEYEGKRGPRRWGSLTRQYAICADGSAQSPIDLRGAVPTDLPNLRFDYRPGALTFANTTHTVQADEAQGSSVEADGQRYALLQFHFHEPSEHRVAGRRLAGELHFVHRDPDGRLAVVAVLVRAGRRNTALDPIFGKLPTRPGSKAQVTSFDTAALLPSTGRRFYTYGGSLTTPPCSEGVRWYVLKDPVEASVAQLRQFRGVIESNSRPVQPRNGRVVRIDRN